MKRTLLGGALDSPRVLATLPDGAANDGVALDSKGRLYELALGVEGAPQP